MFKVDFLLNKQIKKKKSDLPTKIYCRLHDFHPKESEERAPESMEYHILFHLFIC